MMMKLILLGYCIMGGAYGTFQLLFAEEELPVPVKLICLSIFLSMFILGIKSFHKNFKRYGSPDYEDYKREKEPEKAEKRRVKKAEKEDWEMDEYEEKKPGETAKKVGKGVLIAGGVAAYMGIGLVAKLTSKYMRK